MNKLADNSKNKKKKSTEETEEDYKIEDAITEIDKQDEINGKPKSGEISDSKYRKSDGQNLDNVEDNVKGSEANNRNKSKSSTVLPETTKDKLVTFQAIVEIESTKRSLLLKTEDRLNTPYNYELQSTGTLGNNGAAFKFVENTPHFFELYKTSMYEVRNDEYTIPYGYAQIEGINASNQMFSSGTGVVRVKLCESINGFSINNPNTPSIAPIDNITFFDSRYSPGSKFDYINSRLETVMDIFKATDMVIHKTVKLVRGVTGVSTGHKIGMDLTNFRYQQDSTPHFYLSYFEPANEVVRSRIEEMYSQAPIMLGSDKKDSINGIKLGERYQVITDQFAAAIANSNYELFKQRNRSVNLLGKQIKACLLPGDQIILDNQYSGTYTPYYDATDGEYNLMLHIMLMSVELQNQWYKLLLDEIYGTKVFKMLPINMVQEMTNLGSDVNGNLINSYLLNKINVGDDITVYEMVMMETFTWMFDFKLADYTLMSDNSMFIFLLSTLAWFNVFPAIAQRMSSQLGTIINNALDLLLDTHYQTWVNHHGRILDIEGRPTAIKPSLMTEDMARRGYHYSFFDNHTISTTENQQMGSLMNSLANMLKPRVAESDVILRTKRQAELPYYRSDYRAYRSWEYFQDFQDTIDNPNHVEKFHNMIDWIRLLGNFKKSMVGKTMQTSTQAYVNSLTSRMGFIVRSSSSLFCYDMARIQEYLMNQPSYVYCEYDPTRGCRPNEELCVPQGGIINGKVVAREGLRISRTTINNINIFLPLALMFRAEGTQTRNITNVFSPNNVKNEQKVYFPIKPEKVLNALESTLFTTRRCGVGLQLMRWVVGDDISSNPLADIGGSIRKMLSIHSRVGIMMNIFSRLEIPITDIFKNYHFDQTTNNQNIELQLRRYDPESGVPMQDSDENEIFGKTFQTIDDVATNSLKIIIKMLFKDSSPINILSQGAYIGRFFVEEYDTYHPTLEEKWVVLNKKYFRFDKVDVKGGRSPAIIYKHTVYDLVKKKNVIKTDTVFLDSEFKYKLMLEIDTIADIPAPYLPWISIAIHSGFIALKVTKQQFMVRVEDIVTIPKHELWGLEYIEKLVQLGHADLMTEVVVPSSKYSMNYTLGQTVYSNYKQWFVPIQATDTSVYAAKLTETPTTGMRVPTAKMLMFGEYVSSSSSRLKIDDVDKLDLGYVNWNNSYQALNTETAIAEPKFIVTPRNPAIFEY